MPPDSPALAAEHEGARLILDAINGEASPRLGEENQALLKAVASHLRQMAPMRPALGRALARIAEDISRARPSEQPDVLDRFFTASPIHLGGTIAMSEVNAQRGNARDSSQLLSSDLAKIAKTVKERVERGYVPVITHGTDSLDTTGLVLSQLFPDRRIVLTAAFIPYASLGSDGPQNYKDALLLARLKNDPRVPRAPYAVMNGAVYLASSLVKLDSDFRGGRRGMKSYAGQVGTIAGDAIVWDREFLESFERDREDALLKTRGPRDSIVEEIERGSFRFADVEIAYVNRFTPERYIEAMLSRLERGESQALIWEGPPPGSARLMRRIKRLNSRGKPVFIQGYNFPKGIEPFQLLYKTSLFLNYARSRSELNKILRSNISGEVLAKPADPALRSEFEGGNFYRSGDVSRGFILYHQNFPLMKSALTAEIARLGEEARRGRRAELIIEGIGNGHIYIGRAGSESGLLDLLSQARALGIQVTIATRVKDAVPDSSYEVGKKLLDVGVRLAPFAGRSYLRSLAKKGTL